MKEKQCTKKIAVLILVVLLSFIEIFMLPTLLLSSFINHNTAAYMLFDVPIEETWEQPADYKWNDTDETYKEYVSEEFAALADIEFNTYNKWHYLDELSTIFVEQVGVPEADVETLWNTSTIDVYINEFVKMQAGYFVGENMIPTPYMDDINTTLDTSINRLNNETLSSWYNDNGVALKASLKHAMVTSNDVLYEKLNDSNLAYGETCSLLKVFNLMVVFYVLLSIVVVLLYILFKVFKNDWAYTAIYISQIIVMLLTTATYIEMTSFSLVVFGIPYSPTKEMVQACAPMYVALMITFAVLTVIFLNKKYSLWKNVNSVIFKKHK